MRDAILPLLTPFLKLVYDGITTPNLKAKVTKVIDIWYTKRIFESTVIDAILRDVTGQLIPRQHADSPRLQASQQKQLQQTRPLPASMTQQHHPVSSPAPAQVPVIEKPYFELPAGLMLLTKVWIMNLIYRKLRTLTLINFVNSKATHTSPWIQTQSKYLIKSQCRQQKW